MEILLIFSSEIEDKTPFRGTLWLSVNRQLQAACKPMVDGGRC